MSVNKIILLGRLGTEPELKYLPNGSAVCNFTLATSEKYTDKNGEKKENTEWHKIVVWGKIAELCNQYLKKGSQAFIEGKIQTRSYDDKDGNKKYITEINASSVQFLDSKSSDSEMVKSAKETFGVKGKASNFITDEDVPF